MKTLSPILKTLYLLIIIFSAGVAKSQIGIEIDPNYESKIKHAMQELSDKAGSLDLMLQYFCAYNEADTLLGSRIIDLVKVQPSMKNSSKNEFYIKIFNCLTKNQIDNLFRWLNTFLNETDKEFYEIVSLYNLKKYKKFLEMHLAKDFWEVLLKEALSSGLKRKTRFQLQNLITLGNLYPDLYEDSILININRIFEQVKNTKNPIKLKSFYTQVITRELANLNSKKSVLETLYLLDDDGLYALGKEKQTTYVFLYFSSVISQKLIDANVMMLGSLGEIEENKEKIKDVILNDNSIWKKHIRL